MLLRGFLYGPINKCEGRLGATEQSAGLLCTSHAGVERTLLPARRETQHGPVDPLRLNAAVVKAD